jgi:hypothetical protein
MHLAATAIAASLTFGSWRSITMRSRAILGLVAVLAACGGDDDEPFSPPERGDFAATLTGAVSRTFSGISAFDTDASGGEVGMLILLESADGRDLIGFFRESPVVPAAATYTVVDGSGSTPLTGDVFAVQMLLDDGGASELECLSTDGSVTITSSTAATTATATRVAGTFEVAMECFPVVDPTAEAQLVTLTGEFDAPQQTLVTSRTRLRERMPPP